MHECWTANFVDTIPTLASSIISSCGETRRGIIGIRAAGVMASTTTVPPGWKNSARDLSGVSPPTIRAITFVPASFRHPR